MTPDFPFLVLGLSMGAVAIIVTAAAFHPIKPTLLALSLVLPVLVGLSGIARGFGRIGDEWDRFAEPAAIAVVILPLVFLLISLGWKSVVTSSPLSYFSLALIPG